MALSTAGAIGGMVYGGLPVEATAAVASMGAVGTVGVGWMSSKSLQLEEERILSPDGLNEIFETNYSGEVIPRTYRFRAMQSRILNLESLARALHFIT